MAGIRQLYVVIIGCGRLGSYLAEQLSRRRHRVMVIDHDPEALKRLSSEYSGFQLEGDASELQVLRQANVQNADVVIVTTQLQNVNLLVSQIARRVLGVPRVIARVSELGGDNVYRDLGIETVSAVSMVGGAILNSLTAPGSCAETRQEG